MRNVSTTCALLTCYWSLNMLLDKHAKTQIVNSLTIEKDLRENLLVPLYRNMGFSQVDLTHGANEKGTDIVLTGKSEFGDYTYTSVIVKSTPINNATSGKNTAANLIQQITLAINSGYDCPIQK